MPRKLGQHFLHSDAILSKIAQAACGEFTPRVIEIGPGRGALTRHLLARTHELHAIELDSTLIPRLEREFAQRPAFHLHHADVLETDLAQWGPAVVIGNLPYYITSPIIERFLKLGSGNGDRPAFEGVLRDCPTSTATQEVNCLTDFPRAVFLIQLEVAERLRASPGSRDYGFLTVQTQLFCDVELIAKVPPGAFSPPPKVHSAVVRLTRRATPDEQTESFLRFAGWCFAQKRKTLRNNLKGKYPAEVLDRLPEANLRAEQLSVQQLVQLHHTLAGSTAVHAR